MPSGNRSERPLSAWAPTWPYTTDAVFLRLMAGRLGVAPGADATRVAGMIRRDGIGLTPAGIAVSLAVMLLLAVIALPASYLPAQRAE